MKMNTYLGFLLVLFAFSSLASAQRYCLHDIYVKTGNLTDAGTDSKVTLRLRYPNTSFFDYPDLEMYGTMPPGHKYFEWNGLDRFRVRLYCRVTPCSLTLTIDPSEPRPHWFCHVVVVREPETQKDQLFLVDQWLDVKKPSATVNMCGTALDDEKNNVVNPTAAI